MRRSAPVLCLALAAVAALCASPRSAAALPAVGELYVGGGAQSHGGLPGFKAGPVGYNGCLEVGLDDFGFLRDWGLGVRADWAGPQARWSGEVRYQLTSLPTTRVFAIANVAVDGSGRGGAVLATRTLLGLPYVGAQLGLYRDAAGQWSPAATMTLGLAL